MYSHKAIDLRDQIVEHTGRYLLRAALGIYYIVLI